MIKIVKSLRARDIDSGDPAFLSLPLIPATGMVEKTSETADAGRYEKVSFSARLRQGPLRDLLDRDLMMKIDYDDGTSDTFGTEDLPVRLKVVENTLLTVSAEWTHPII